MNMKGIGNNYSFKDYTRKYLPKISVSYLASYFIRNKIIFQVISWVYRGHDVGRTPSGNYFITNYEFQHMTMSNQFQF